MNSKSVLNVKSKRFTSLSILLFLALAIAAIPIASQQPASRPRGLGLEAANIERRIDQLLARMTLEEKLGQLQQLDGEANGNYRPEHVEMVRKGLLGSTLNVRGAARTNELQRVAVNESRLKIPMVFGFDVIHGYRTVFPIPLGEAATWDPAALERSAAIAAREARAAGVHWTFAPMVDIARDARWGRIAEGSGEDPYLGAMLAAARVRGFQGSDYSAPDKVVATAKHWVAYGAAEAGRDYNTTDLSERSLREVYFPPFKAAIDAKVGTFMTAFNDINGVPATANPFVLSDVLRSEWKFDGLVVSDYTAVMELMNHGLARDEADAASLALNAGTDMEMVSRLYNKHGAALIRERKVSLATLNEAVRRVLRIKFRLGLFEKPYADEVRETNSIFTPEHLAAAREIAARSMVLLKNQGDFLPLSKGVKTIAVIGPLADSQKDMIGSWTGDGKAEDAVTLLTGVKSKVSPQTTVRYAKGCELNDNSTAGLDEAVRVARESDVVIVAVGESAEMSGEAASRSSLDLPGQQMQLIKAIHATGKPYAVVLMNGRPLTISWIAENSPAILETWFAGTQGGHAIADVLFGDVNPSGKLPVTFPRALGQVPIYYNHKNTGRPPTDQKYTSKYLDVPVTPLFHFGHGLSYTKFKLSDLRKSAERISPDGTLTVSIEIENIGTRAGEEVVQLYINDVASSVT